MTLRQTSPQLTAVLRLGLILGCVACSRVVAVVASDDMERMALWVTHARQKTVDDPSIPVLMRHALVIQRDLPNATDGEKRQILDYTRRILAGERIDPTRLDDIPLLSKLPGFDFLAPIVDAGLYLGTLGFGELDRDRRMSEQLLLAGLNDKTVYVDAYDKARTDPQFKKLLDEYIGARQLGVTTDTSVTEFLALRPELREVHDSLFVLPRADLEKTKERMATHYAKVSSRVRLPTAQAKPRSSAGAPPPTPPASPSSEAGSKPVEDAAAIGRRYRDIRAVTGFLATVADLSGDAQLQQFGPRFEAFANATTSVAEAIELYVGGAITGGAFLLNVGRAGQTILSLVGAGNARVDPLSAQMAQLTQAIVQMHQDLQLRIDVVNANLKVAIEALNSIIIGLNSLTANVQVVRADLETLLSRTALLYFSNLDTAKLAINQDVSLHSHQCGAETHDKIGLTPERIRASLEIFRTYGVETAKDPGSTGTAIASRVTTASDDDIELIAEALRERPGDNLKLLSTFARSYYGLTSSLSSYDVLLPNVLMWHRAATLYADCVFAAADRLAPVSSADRNSDVDRLRATYGVIETHKRALSMATTAAGTTLVAAAVSKSTVAASALGAQVVATLETARKDLAHQSSTSKATENLFDPRVKPCAPGGGATMPDLVLPDDWAVAPVIAQRGRMVGMDDNVITDPDRAVPTIGPLTVCYQLVKDDVRDMNNNSAVGWFFVSAEFVAKQDDVEYGKWRVTSPRSGPANPLNLELAQAWTSGGLRDQTAKVLKEQLSENSVIAKAEELVFKKQRRATVYMAWQRTAWLLLDRSNDLGKTAQKYFIETDLLRSFVNWLYPVTRGSNVDLDRVFDPFDWAVGMPNAASLRRIIGCVAGGPIKCQQAVADIASGLESGPEAFLSGRVKHLGDLLQRSFEPSNWESQESAALAVAARRLAMAGNVLTLAPKLAASQVSSNAQPAGVGDPRAVSRWTSSRLWIVVVGFVCLVAGGLVVRRFLA
jgi:hypothetical protein